MQNKYSFKYKNSSLFKIPLILFSILYILGSILIFTYVPENITKLTYMLLFFLIIILWLIQIKKKLDITNGEFEFNENELNYITLNKMFCIKYDEILSIKKENYLENTNIISYNSYQYIISIKNSGFFIFKFYDQSLDIAIQALADKLNIEIKME